MNSSLDENDFVTWEEDSDENNISYHKSSSPKEYDVCKCLGSIDGVECGTYYFVSSIKKHRGCAKRDCSNSSQNYHGKIVFGRSTEKRVEYKKSNSSEQVFLAIIGILFFFVGIASELVPLVIFGVICFIAIVVMSSGESISYGYKKVTFKLVERREIPKNAIDPWTQEKILKTIKKNGSFEGGYVGWQ